MSVFGDGVFTEATALKHGHEGGPYPDTIGAFLRGDWDKGVRRGETQGGDSCLQGGERPQMEQAPISLAAPGVDLGSASSVLELLAKLSSG